MVANYTRSQTLFITMHNGKEMHESHHNFRVVSW